MSSVANHAHTVMITVYQSSGGCFQQDNTLCHLEWFLERENDFTVLKWPPVSRS